MSLSSDTVERDLQRITNRYLARYPPVEYTIRASRRDGIVRDDTGRYVFDLDRVFPGAEPQDVVYAWAGFHGDKKGEGKGEREVPLSVTCDGPTTVFHDGEVAFQSTNAEEATTDHERFFSVEATPGWNSLLLRFVKTNLGFGARFGTTNWNQKPLHTVVLSEERFGAEGWLLAPPREAADLETPPVGMPEAETGVSWVPDPGWGAPDAGRTVGDRLFDAEPGDTAYAWTRLVAERGGVSSAEVSLSTHGPTTGWVGSGTGNASDREVVAVPGATTTPVEIPLASRSEGLLFRTAKTADGFGIDLDVETDGVSLVQPRPVEGSAEPWLYLGPFGDDPPEPGAVADLYRIFEGRGGHTYWRLDAPGTWIRPFVEDRTFGAWSYPVALALIGLVRAGRLLDREDVFGYAAENFERVAGLYEYMSWDQDAFGFPGVAPKLANPQLLEDTALSAAALVETTAETTVEGHERLIGVAEEFLTEDVPRLPDGGAYRDPAYRETFKPYMPGTLWVDDLSMTCPLSCRLYERTGEERYLEDAITQIRSYRERLYMPESGLFGHVYHVGHDAANDVPWGRGNAWALYALGEVLETLPESHASFEDLRSFFETLCGEYVARQGDGGFWHQLLDEPDTFEETSCTAIFAGTLARGVRQGWLEPADQYARAARRAWEALSEDAISEGGDVKGICEGSSYSFAREYYRSRLEQVTNDLHGIGAVLVGGVELAKLEAGR